jgi:hypothetical protein
LKVHRRTVDSAIAQSSKPATKKTANVSATTQALCERFRRASRAADLLESLAPDMPEVTSVAVERVPIEQYLNGLTVLPPDALEAGLRDAETQVRAFERSIERLDRKFPTTWFRKYCQITPQNALGFAEYAGLLVTQLGADDSVRLDRAQLIVTRLVEALAPRASASREQRHALVAEILPACELDDGTVEGAVAYLEDAVKELEAFAHFEELLASELFLETRGYKLSLRANILHPAIMAAAIEFNESVDATIQRLARADLPAGADLKAHLAAADTRIRELFARGRTDESPTEKGFKALQKRRASWQERREAKEAQAARTERRRKEKEQWAEPKRRPWAWVLALAVVGAVTFVRMPHRVDTHALSQDELQALSPLLVSGATGPAKKPVMLMAQVNAEAWRALPAAQHHETAEALARAMGDGQLLEGTVMMNGTIVIQIRQGQVLIVR